MRLGKLQKRIITCLFELGPAGEYESIEAVNKSDEQSIRELTDQGYIFTNELLDPQTKLPSGELRYTKKLPNYFAHRSSLAFNVFSWQKWNKFVEGRFGAERDAFRQLKHGFIPDYSKKQATLTRSLQLLAGDGLVDLLMRFDHPISIYSPTASLRIKAESEDFEAKRRNGFEYLKLKYANDPAKDNQTFEQWIAMPRTGLFGNQYTNIGLYRADNDHRLFRNIVKVRLTHKGISKVQSLLKVNSGLTVSKLTFRTASI